MLPACKHKDPCSPGERRVFSTDIFCTLPFFRGLAGDQVPRSATRDHGPAGCGPYEEGESSHRSETSIGRQDPSRLARLEAEGLAEEVRYRKCSGSRKVKKVRMPAFRAEGAAAER